MEEEAEKLKEMQGEVEKQMMSTKTSMILHDALWIQHANVQLYVWYMPFSDALQIIFLHQRKNKRQMQDQFMLGM